MRSPLPLIPLAVAFLAAGGWLVVLNRADSAALAPIGPSAVPLSPFDFEESSPSRRTSTPGRVGDRDGDDSTERTPSPSGADAWHARPCYGFRWSHCLSLSGIPSVAPSGCGGLPCAPPKLRWTGRKDHDRRVGYWEARDGKGRVRSLRRYVDGVLQGIARDWSESGALDAEWSFRDGHYEGLYRAFRSDGRVCWEGRYARGKRDGTWRFVESGGAMQILTYAKGIKHGPERDSDDAGRLRYEGGWDQGRPSGLHRAFHENGRLAERATYHRGGLHGLWQRWHPNGRLAAEGRAEFNRPVGAWRSDYADGRPCARRFFRDGRAEGTYEHWNENGVLLTRNRYRNGEQHGVQETFEEEGRPMTYREFDRGRLHGVERIWDVTLIDEECDPDEEEHWVYYLEEERHYRRGNLEGPESSWNETGVLLSLCHYVNDELHGLETIWDDAGRKRQERHWRHDEQSGLELLWREDGSLASRKLWHSDDVCLRAETYDSAGRLRAIKTHDENGEPVGVWVEIDPRGLLVSQEAHRNGEPVGDYIHSQCNEQGEVVASLRAIRGDDGELMGEGTPIAPRSFASILNEEGRRPKPAPFIYRCGATHH